MSQATPTNLAAKVESLGEADLLPFHELLDVSCFSRKWRNATSEL
jgi:hypothetical protein